MWEKFRAMHEGSTVALKFNQEKGLLVLGGPLRFRSKMVSYATEYFTVDMSRPTHPQRNKVRFSMRCSKKKFDTGRRKLEEDGVVVESVEKHGRLLW